jgi:shikimate 5-dehydrogenase
MRRFGLIGNPVAGSLSPRLFEAAYGGRYPYDLIEGADFGRSWQRFLDGYDGINITAPFKLDAFRSVDVLSDSARLCGAVNLAVKTPDGIVGYNTDVDGVVLSVQETGIRVSEALVVGCGGAGRAAAVAALRLGCHVTLVNRTPSRASSLATELGCGWMPVEALGGSDSGSWSPSQGAVPRADLVIYTVPGPMKGLPDFPDSVILEANYRTPVLAGRGRAYVSGLRWLLYQAVAGYSIFTSEAPDRDAMLRIFC